MQFYAGPKVRGTSLIGNTNSKKKERRAARATLRNSKRNAPPSRGSRRTRRSIPPSRGSTRSIQPTNNPLRRRIELG
jgi:hypothetical protein